MFPPCPKISREGLKQLFCGSAGDNSELRTWSRARGTEAGAVVPGCEGCKDCCLALCGRTERGGYKAVLGELQGDPCVTETVYFPPLGGLRSVELSFQDFAAKLLVTQPIGPPTLAAPVSRSEKVASVEQLPEAPLYLTARVKRPAGFGTQWRGREPSRSPALNALPAEPDHRFISNRRENRGKDAPLAFGKDPLIPDIKMKVGSAEADEGSFPFKDVLPAIDEPLGLGVGCNEVRSCATGETNRCSSLVERALKLAARC